MEQSNCPTVQGNFLQFGDRETNCVSPILKTSTLKRRVNEIKGALITSPNLSTSKNKKRKKRVGIGERINRIKEMVCSNGGVDLSTKVKDLPDQSTSLKVNDCISTHTTDDNDVLSSPILKTSNEKRMLCSSNRKSIRKKLFSNLEDNILSHKTTETNKNVLCKIHVNDSTTLASNTSYDNAAENKLINPFEVIIENNFAKANQCSPVITSQSKSNYSNKYITNKEFIKNLENIYSRCSKLQNEDVVVKGIEKNEKHSKRCCRSHKMKEKYVSNNNGEDKSSLFVAGNDLVEKEHRFDVPSLSSIKRLSWTPEVKETGDTLDDQFTISQFPSPNNRNVLPLMKKTTNFNKVWSIEKSHFENIFESSASDEDLHISDHSSPISKFQVKKLTSNVLDERQTELSNTFNEQINSNSITFDISNDSDEDTCSKNGSRLRSKFSHKSKRKKGKSDLIHKPVLEIDHRQKVRHLKCSDHSDFDFSSKSSHKLIHDRNSESVCNNIKESERRADSFNCDWKNIEDSQSPIIGSAKVNNISLVSTKSQVSRNLFSHLGILDVSKNDSLQIQNNSTSCSQVSSQCHIEPISSPSDVLVNKSVDQIQFSDCSSIDKVCRTPPSKLIQKESVNWDELLDSGTKRRRKKYPEDSLVGRFYAIKNRFESDVRMKQYMLSHAIQSTVDLPVLTVKKIWQEYSRSLIICNSGNNTGCNHGHDSKTILGENEIVSHEIYILTTPMTLTSQNISCGSLLRVHPPWNVLYFAHENITMVLGVTCVEVVPKTTSLSENVDIDTNLINNTVTINVDCVCFPRLVEDPQCGFQLTEGTLTDILCPLALSNISEPARKRIPRLYLNKNHLAGTIGNFRAFRVLNPDSYIVVTVLLTHNHQSGDGLTNGKLCVVVKDTIDEIGIIVLSTKSDIDKWRIVSGDLNKIDKYFKLCGLKFAHRVLFNKCKITHQYKINILTNQNYVYYMRPASDWWTIVESNCD